MIAANLEYTNNVRITIKVQAENASLFHSNLIVEWKTQKTTLYLSLYDGKYNIQIFV
jgi:hypothetical protein